MWNEAFGWAWVCLGMVSGAWLGMGFTRDDHLGGYASWKRRLLRLGHIAFFGTGILNILFGVAADRIAANGPWRDIASWSFLIGALLMPLVCCVSAFYKRAGVLFVLPVLTLLAGAVLTTAGLVLDHLTGGL